MNTNEQQNDGPSGNKMLRMNDWSLQLPDNANQGVHYIDLQPIEQNQNPFILDSNYFFEQQHQQQQRRVLFSHAFIEFALKLKIDFFYWFFLFFRDCAAIEC